MNKYQDAPKDQISGFGIKYIKGVCWNTEGKGSRCEICKKRSHAILDVNDNLIGYCYKHYKQLTTEGLISNGNRKITLLLK